MPIPVGRGGEGFLACNLAVVCLETRHCAGKFLFITMLASADVRPTYHGKHHSKTGCMTGRKMPSSIQLPA